MNLTQSRYQPHGLAGACASLSGLPLLRSFAPRAWMQRRVVGTAGNDKPGESTFPRGGT
jgi:hypothetical protein